MGSTDEELHPMFQDMLRRTDGWRPGENVSSLDYDFMTRHPAMSVVFLALTTLAAFVGNIGNFLVIGAILSYRPLLRNKGNMFVINLAVADICITTIVSPMNMVGVTRGPRFFLDKVVLCHLLGSICTVSCLVSMLSIAAVAVNRLIQICKPFVYHRIYTHKKTLIYCFALWGWAIILDIPNWVGWGGHTFGLKEMGCTFDRVANYGFTMFLATMSIFIPMTIVFGCYIAIIVFVRRSRNEIRKFGKESAIRRSSTPKGGTARKMSFKKDDLQFAFILFVSFLAFVLCWSLYMVALIFDFKDRWPKEIYVAGTILGHTNSCLNSIIYALGYARFRKGYIIFIRKLFCLKTQRNSAALNDSKYSLRYTSKVTGPLSTPITGRSRVLQLDDNPISPPVTTPLTTMCRHGNGWMR
ncbi:melatonin receptor type 1B-B-like isoform X1 [Dreissena polymorpha]|uniref:melatonin receptor type 1B-B-like isoform X1 n=1 Tax=Dreissena polymorpha TaxID=45954 RepID=UPI002264319C|nr:melatonin receptor type 1B-B-like isoform X1 [Dreissena polymorpha]XP_052230389.1 melatonin receptor type 1B-B-like isoform X1 [Dreissena polymorpha]XP_052230390.1 melatonin receptor type 1B-B-like isoform X1 [Dreissena polymorpha]XP_052230391.1 melatonin receptor type 1B-B-like isoform X1 [Dreissena polymorpha]XP_052230392.1 melatonin receptor type 1B-B-like isoform X1 [Dreissena polymorpha]XP_052230393.1 melatonin receptor type 1B-B-like isoform X1 [Dreissena polymorpha]